MSPRPPLPAPPDAADRAVINAMQEDFPLDPRPFALVAERLDMAEEDLIARIGALRESGLITRFGPFFDVAAMGGQFCLCAMAVPAERFEEVVSLVNAHSEVAHNYQREHHLNMWFVLACLSAEAVEKVALQIERETGLAVLRFPKLKEFFVGFRVKA